jgi:hypothetical protein
MSLTKLPRLARTSFKTAGVWLFGELKGTEVINLTDNQKRLPSPFNSIVMVYACVLVPGVSSLRGQTIEGYRGRTFFPATAGRPSLLPPS